MHQIYASRFHEVQDYLSMTNHIYSPIFLTVGSKKWATHPPEIRAEIERIAREVEEFSYRQGQQMDIDLRQLFEEHGIEVNEVDRPAFVQASRSIYEEFGAMIPEGNRWIEETLALEALAPVPVPAEMSTPQSDSTDARSE